MNTASGSPVAVTIISQVAPYVTVSESHDFADVAQLEFPEEEGLVCSLVIVPWVDFGASKRMFGRQWLIDPHAGRCVLRVSCASATLSANAGPLVTTESWDEHPLREEEIYAAVLSIHTIDGRLQEERIVELVYLTTATLALFKLCVAGQYVEDYLQGLVTCSRFAGLLTNYCSVSMQGKKVLVSGCGTGGECAIVQDLGAQEVVGIDTNGNHISAGQARFSKRDFFRLRQYDGQRIHEPDNSFDVVISRHVLEHVSLESRWQYCAEILRVLKPHGTAIFEFPNHRSPIEAHTDVEFFHLLPHSTKWDILEYYYKCEQAGAPRHPNMDKYVALSCRINVTKAEFLYYLRNLPCQTHLKNEFRLHPTLGVIDHDCCRELRFEVEKLPDEAKL